VKLSLYRKYRPQTFSEVVGQDHVAQTLTNALRDNAVAHAYIFAGPRGIGKTSMAKILAKALNCERFEEPTITPCGECDSCRSIAAGTSLDVIEMDAASNRGIDDIRELRDKVAFAPVQGRSKVYIVDEVHMLTKEAFNALLKTLEEPPPHVVFVLATTEVHKIPETIVSRCQRFDFRRPLMQEIMSVLARIATAEGVTVDPEALAEIARHAEGGFRDAIGTLDKLTTFYEGQSITGRDVVDLLGVVPLDLLVELTDIVIDRDTAAALLFVQRLADAGTNLAQFIRDLLRHLRQLFLLHHLGEISSDVAMLRTLGQNVGLDDQRVAELLQQANQFDQRELVYLIEKLGQAQSEIKAGLDARLQLELALVKVMRPQVDHSASALEERLRRLEAGDRAGGAPPAAAPRRAAPAAAVPQRAQQAPAAASDEKSAKQPGGAADPTTIDDVVGGAQSAGAQEAGASAAPSEATTDAPPTPAAEATEALTLERVQRAWELVLQRVQASSVALYGLLHGGRPARLNDDRLTIALPSKLALKKAAEPSNRAVLVRAVAEILGHTVALEFEPSDGHTQPAAEAAPAAEAELSQAELQALVIKKFDATLLPEEE